MVSKTNQQMCIVQKDDWLILNCAGKGHTNWEKYRAKDCTIEARLSSQKKEFALL